MAENEANIENTNKLNEFIEKIQTLINEYGYKEAILSVKDDEQVFLTPLTDDLKYLLGTATSILNIIFKISEEDIVKFYLETGIIQANETKNSNSF
jgi:predicted transcriptional regulator